MDVHNQKLFEENKNPQSLNKRALQSKSKVSGKDKDRSNIVGEDKIVASNTIMLEQNLITREDKNRKQTFEGACKS